MATDVGIRQLRQNLSVYLRRVAKGERFVVTERGKPVAELVPRLSEEESWERLLAEHGMTKPTRSLEDLPPPMELDTADPHPGTRGLFEERGDPLPPHE